MDDQCYDFVSDFSLRFRWVALQLNYLSTCHSMWTLRKALDGLPPGLDETYSRILEKVNDHERPRLRLMLQWLCFSFRPLRVEELADIFHVGDAIGPPFNPDALVFQSEDVLDVCPGLLSLTTTRTVSKAPWYETAWGCFRPGRRLQIAKLAHFSVKEFLLQSSSYPTWLPLNQELAHLSILKSSMAYFMSVATKLRNDTQWRYRTWHELAISHSLAIYCAQYTQNHLLALSHREREHPDLLESFRSLLDPHSRFTTQGFAPFYLGRWFTIKPYSAICKKRMPAAGVSLLIAVRLGLTKMVDWLLSFDGENCTEEDDVKCDINFVYVDAAGCYGPAVAEASAQGYIDTVKLLLGDRYHAQLDGDWGNALCNAAVGGHEEIVRLLIGAGAAVNTQSPTQGPLHAALHCGNVNIVRTLLAHGADVNAVCSCETPLQIATNSGQAKNVRMLIDAGADVNLGGDTPFGRLPPLQLAVIRGRIDLVRMLLDAKADIGGVSGYGNTALGLAAASGHEETVKLLLDLVKKITKEMKTAALAKANESRHDTIAAMLLASGADPAGVENI
jgi:hypothetical protein